MITVVCIDGVLSEENLPLLQAGPTITGKRIYEYLRGANSAIVLLTPNRNSEGVKAWLMREGFGEYIRLLTREESSAEPGEWKVEALKDLIAAGQHIAFYVDSDPLVTGPIASLGIPYLLVVHPWGKPGRMDSLELPYKTWGALVDTIEEESLRQAALRKERMERSELAASQEM